MVSSTMIHPSLFLLSLRVSIFTLPLKDSDLLLLAFLLDPLLGRPHPPFVEQGEAEVD